MVNIAVPFNAFLTTSSLCVYVAICFCTLVFVICIRMLSVIVMVLLSNSPIICRCNILGVQAMGSIDKHMEYL